MTTLITGGIEEIAKTNPDLITLMQTQGLEVTDKSSVEEVGKLLQSKWYQGGKFRFQIQGNRPCSGTLALLTKLGCINEITAHEGRYLDYHGAIVLGAVLSRVQNRLKYLAWQHRNGIRFEEVFLLGSSRPLDENVELSILNKEFGADPGIKIPKTEIEMMQFVSARYDFVKEWKAKIIPISVPDVPLENGSRSANTGETLSAWQNRGGASINGHFLVVSNQPFVTYQLTNARRLLSKYLQLVGIGSAADTSLPLATFLDNLAKQFYEEYQYRQKRIRLMSKIIP